jgi:(2Fe-2S) ferredoxin
MGKIRPASGFTLSGKFLGYVFKDDYKIKRLKLATEQSEYSIKMTKAAKASLQHTLLPGDRIQVMGEQTFDRETQTLKLKAHQIQCLDAMVAAPQPQATAQPKKSSILVCEKSTCMKRGGKAVCKALEMALSDRGLADEVKIKGTGCMKACGKGPNVVFMPGKVHYTKISAKDIPALVDEHFTIVPAAATPRIATPTLPVPNLAVQASTVAEQPVMVNAQ